jgi:release factor glutamine methyltransferase
MNFFNRLKQQVIIILIKAVQKFGKHRYTIMGSTFEISENVFNPKYYYTSIYMAKNIKVSTNDIVLDMGTGSGIQAVNAAQTASKVVAIDINPEAVKYAKINVTANGLNDRISVMEGDLFSPLEKGPAFSVILFTPPYLEGMPRSGFEHALFDPEKTLMTRFFSEAQNYLKTDGYIQMLYSSMADHESVLSIARELGWHFELISQQDTFSEKFLIYKITRA